MKFKIGYPQNEQSIQEMCFASCGHPRKKGITALNQIVSSGIVGKYELIVARSLATIDKMGIRWCMKEVINFMSARTLTDFNLTPQST